MEVVVTDRVSPEEREAVLAPLAAFNAARVGPAGTRPFAALLRDAEGRTLGGAIGFSRHRWLFVELLFLPEGLRGRGLGRRVMAAAEEEARARGCVGVHLDTGSFQSPGFYEALGFARIGTLEDHPPGHANHWYAKRLCAAPDGDH